MENYLSNISFVLINKLAKSTTVGKGNIMRIV